MFVNHSLSMLSAGGSRLPSLLSLFQHYAAASLVAYAQNRQEEIGKIGSF